MKALHVDDCDHHVSKGIHKERTNHDKPFPIPILMHVMDGKKAAPLPHRNSYAEVHAQAPSASPAHGGSPRLEVLA